VDETVDWQRVVLDTLIQAGGEQFFVPGAKLRPLLDVNAMQAGEDFGSHLRTAGLSFSQFISAVPGLRVVRRPGTDILVGLPGAEVKVSTARPPKLQGSERARGLRQDVYDALTRVTPVPYKYVPESDAFVAESDSPNAIDLPLVGLSDLIERRRKFAEGIGESELKSRLIDALDRSANPLSQFQWVIRELALIQKWHSYNVDTLTQKLQDWAAAINVPVSEAWFTLPTSTQTTETPQDLLTQLARFMTDEEVRSLTIPFDAIEKLYQHLRSKS
jgi:hypothetical protein